MANPDDFTGTPFVLGSIRGERCWNFTAGGLYSPAQRYLWGDGENVSKCNGTGMHQYISMVLRLERNQYANKYISEIEFNNEQGRTVLEVYRKGNDGRSISMSTYIQSSGQKVTHVVVYWMPSRLETVIFPVPSWNEENKTMSTVPGRISREYIVDRKHEYTDIYTIDEFNALSEMNEHHFQDCQCGFYAYTKESANEYIHNSDVLGVVEGYGETLIGTLGFRSEKAKILALAPTRRINWQNKPNIVKMIVDNMDDPETIQLSSGQWVFISGRKAGKASQMEKAEKDANIMILEQLAEAYPSAHVFESVAQMREAFPLGDV